MVVYSQLSANEYMLSSYATIITMKTEPLIKTNPYLQDPAEMQRLIARSVKTSCGVEGIRLSKNTRRLVIVNRREKRIYQTNR
jgi:hypothetical protein